MSVLKHSSLFGPYVSYAKKRSVVNTTPGAVFTTLYFLCNLRMKCYITLGGGRHVSFKTLQRVRPLHKLCRK
jgi:hypothetical protein